MLPDPEATACQPAGRLSDLSPLPFLPLDTGHLQNFLRCQSNKTNYNLVCETLQFLDCICGSTTGGLGLLGLYINEKNVALINQTLESLTEYCQGPCHENQVCARGRRRCVGHDAAEPRPAVMWPLCSHSWPSEASLNLLPGCSSLPGSDLVSLSSR